MKRSLGARGRSDTTTAGAAAGQGAALRATDRGAARKDRRDATGRAGASSRCAGVCAGRGGSAEIAAGLRRPVSLAWAALDPSRSRRGAAGRGLRTLAEARGADVTNQATSWEERREGTEDGAAGIAALKRADGSHLRTGRSPGPPRPPAPGAGTLPDSSRLPRSDRGRAKVTASLRW